jgi:dTDP-4-amino-4,6-dideoxygalactose transaminase
MIPIMRPLLPKKEQLVPYLRRIDTNRWYSNYGPLNEEYEEKLSERFGCSVVTCASGTVGITASLLALMGYHYKSRPMIGMPSWTFCATASAVFAAGCRPLLCDVNEDNELDVWGTGGCQGYVVVCPLGRSINIPLWEERLSGTPFVIDGAAAFDTLREIENAPVVVSTHCTKVFGTGEGGFVLSKNKELIEQIRRILNQGMLPDKNIAEIGFNGKLSEYHAAVGLAELAGWEEKREKWLEVGKLHGEKDDYVVSSHDRLLPEGTNVQKVVAALATRGIQARSSWYGCHNQEAYTKVWFDQMGNNSKIRMPMARTEMLMRRTIFLPKYIGMTKKEVAEVEEKLAECMRL